MAARIKIGAGGVWRKVMPRQSLMGLIKGRQVPLATVCGLGNCGTDMVLILEGAENLSPMLPTEQRTLTDMEAPDNARLACVTRLIDGDVVVEVPEESLQAA